MRSVSLRAAAASLMCLSPLLAQDECTGAVPVVDGPNGPFSNIGASLSAPAWTCSVGDTDVWFTYVASCSGVGTFDTCGATFDTVLEVFDSSQPCGSFVAAIGCNDDSCGRQSVLSVPLTAGNLYHVRVGGFGGDQGSFPLNIGCSGAVLPNDECSGALFVGDGVNGPFANVGSTTSAPPWICAFGANDVWFAYVASCTGTVTFDTCGSVMDTVMEVFNSTCAPCGLLSGSAGCSDDDCGFPARQSRVSVAATAGTLFYVRVGGFSGATGAFGLNILCTPGGGGLPDDECSGALPVGLGLNAGFSNVGYTLSNPGWSCASGDTDRWFQFTANCTCPHTIHTCSGGTTFDTTLEVFSGSCSCGLVGEACADDFCGVQSSVTANMVTGQTYFIRVGGFNGATGTFDLTIATGTNTGAIGVTVASLCPSPATLAVSGDPNIGGFLQLTLSGATGLPFVGYGFNPNIPIPLPCGCDAISDGLGGLGTLFFGTSVLLNIPCDVVFIGVPVNLQGVDAFPTSGGCTFLGVPFGLTDIWTCTIG